MLHNAKCGVYVYRARLVVATNDPPRATGRSLRLDGVVRYGGLVHGLRLTQKHRPAWQVPPLQKEGKPP